MVAVVPLDDYIEFIVRVDEGYKASRGCSRSAIRIDAQDLDV